MKLWEQEAIYKTEQIGDAAADLADAIRAIQYDPEGATELDTIILGEIQELIYQAAVKAEWLEKSLHRKEQTR